MTDISVTRTDFQVENRSWLLGPHGTEPGTTPSVTLDISAFTEADHYPNGYLPSGLVVGLITASGLYGPYDDAAIDGTETAAGILFSSVKVPDSGADPGGAIVVHGFVDPAKLPANNGLDTAARADLSLIHFAS